MMKRNATILGLLALALAACGPATPAKDGKPSSQAETPSMGGKPFITANPNPVPAGPSPGTTTIQWDTGDGSWGEIYLALPGLPEKLFTRGPKGSAEAPWIGGSAAFEFRLYKGTNHQEVIAKTSVTQKH